MKETIGLKTWLTEEMDDLVRDNRALAEALENFPADAAFNLACIVAHLKRNTSAAMLVKGILLSPDTPARLQAPGWPNVNDEKINANAAN